MKKNTFLLQVKEDDQEYRNNSCKVENLLLALPLQLFLFLNPYFIMCFFSNSSFSPHTSCTISSSFSLFFQGNLVMARDGHPPTSGTLTVLI